jgi:NADH dehydrogenase
MQSTILITGGTGAMGSVLVRKLSDQGYRLRVLTLPGDKNAVRMQASGVDVRFGNIANPSDCRGLCDGVATVLHCAAIIITNDESLYTSVNAGGARNILAEAAAAGGVSNFIHVSSASVVYPKPTPYSISKRLAEDLVRKSGLSWTIVRPTLVTAEKAARNSTYSSII